MVPCCGFQPSSSSLDRDSLWTDGDTTTPTTPTPLRLTGTFFGQRKGRVSFCLQDDTRSCPLLLLEFAVPTAYLAREMQCGLLRIALECSSSAGSTNTISAAGSSSSSLFNVPLWSMYCNGRKVGFAVSRHMSLSDAAVLKQMQSVSVGAGVLPEADLMYMRATFERVIGSSDSESFHMINPIGLPSSLTNSNNLLPHMS
ncbi:hypothetical protein TIFTF001_004789 [Ficus carica]|uniref:Protein MIZU-KUSSEI 1 n=1 Tax=Ficus carica TaxID=3494 RepID=A0AA88CYH3_FICCA|nr:hypothetical protein TIFTF001_004789 [Ficus carica]